MNTTNDRQIRTGHSPAQAMMTLEVQKSTKIGGREVGAGETIQVTRSEARRLMATDKALFKVLVA